MSWPEHTARLTKLVLKSFRGFTERKELDVDADIVLIDGGNGFGKSSVLQAIQVLLAGRSFHKLESLVTRNAEGGRFLVRARVLTGGIGGGPIWIEASGSGRQNPYAFRVTADSNGEPSSGWTDAPEGPHMIGRRLAGRHNARDGNASADDKQPTNEDRELDCRVCSFHPEHIQETFDENARGRVLVDILVEREKWHKNLRDTFGDRDGSLTADANSILDRVSELEGSAADLEADWPADKVPEVALNGREFATRTLELLRDIHQQGWLAEVLNERWRRSLKGSAALPPAGDLLRAIASEQDAPAEERLFAWNNHLSLAESERGVRPDDEAARRLEDLLQGIDAPRQGGRLSPYEQQALMQEWQTLRAKLTEIEPKVRAAREDVADLQDLLDTAAAIGSRTSTWIGALRRKSDRHDFVNLLKEVEAIRVATAREASTELETFLLGRRQILDEQVRLAKRLEEVDEKLRGERETELQRRALDLAEEVTTKWRPFVRMKGWQQAETERRQHAEHLRNAVSEFYQVCALTRQLQPRTQSDLVQQELQRRLAACLRIFHFAGAPQLDLKRGANNLTMETDDRRELEHFSTGQKGVAAVSYIVAQHDLLRNSDPRLLWHDVLLHDDVSTADDLTNLPREALLWRQLAYRDEKPVQIFLCSHHDDLTHGLLDLLAPPKFESGGRPLRMVVHRFKGWSFEKGPKISSFEVEPAGLVDDGGRRAFADDLKRFLA